MTDRPDLYLVLNLPDDAGRGTVAMASDLIDSFKPSSVLLRSRNAHGAEVAGGDDTGSPREQSPALPLDASLAKMLVSTIQDKGVAVLIADDANLARMIKADGLHLSWQKGQLQRIKDAREILGTRYMIGADAGRSRHDAMEIGEAGVDYVAFGIPAHVEDRDTAARRQSDLLNWWSSIFEIPCVAFNIADPDHARLASMHGADFVTVDVDATATIDAARQSLQAIVAALDDAAVSESDVPETDATPA